MIISAIGDVFGWLMYGCFKIVRDYGWTIVVFTLLTKIIMLPISVMVQKNSIKMVKMYPQMNKIKAKFYGSKDLISEEQFKLYKKENYHPMLDLVPVFLQLVILMGVVDVIYKPMRHLLRIASGQVDKLVEIFCSLSGANPQISSIQIQVVENITKPEYVDAFKSSFPADILDKIAGLNMTFCGLDLGAIPAKTFGISIVIPILAALSAWLMCFAQNKINVLQSEQGKVNQITTLLISVGLSLYLGFFVPSGVGVYWIVGNLLSIVQLYILNAWINPKKYIDYEALEESKKELEKVLQYSVKSKKNKNDEYSSLERQDYKRFMKYGEKQIVFYSEKNGFYKYFQNVIESILHKTDIVIHYITNDPKDEVFSKASENFQVYYIGENKLIVLMMKMEADIVVMTTPDLQKYHIKRSMVKDDIEYIYMDHAIGSVNMTFKKHALDYFDTIFVPNDVTYEEIRKQEEVYGLKKKELVKCGFGLIDNMIASYNKEGKQNHDIKEILIAPSWQQDNLLDLCIEPILDQLLGKGYHVILRPHPQYVRHFESKLLALKEKYSDYSDFTLQTDFASNSTVFNADILITDWSGIAYEYSFTTLKPTLFINTPMKVMNQDYQEIDVKPFDITIRDKIGISLNVEDLGKLADTVEKLLQDKSYTTDSMSEIRDRYLYNVENSGNVGADYIIKKLIEYSKK